jgi:hypothetical protein
MNEDEIERELDSIPLGARATVAGVEVERASLFGYRIGPDVLEDQAVLALLMDGSDDRAQRRHEKLLAGAPETEARIAELRRQHGRALRVTGQARAKRARWLPGQEVWLVASFPAPAEGS